MSKTPATIVTSVPQGSVAAPKPADGQSALLALLKVEADARDAKSERDLILLMSNETRKLTRARQVFVLQPSLRGRFEVRGISSVQVSIAVRRL